MNKRNTADNQVQQQWMGKMNQMVGTVNLSNQLPYRTAYSPDLQWQLPYKQKIVVLNCKLQDLSNQQEQKNMAEEFSVNISEDAWMQTNTVNFKHSKMCRSLLWKSWSCDYITLLDLLSMPILSNSYRREPWNCVCCLIPLQADLYTFPAQSYSNTLLMPITRGTLSNLWSLKPIATSSKTCSFYWQLRDGMLSTLIKMAWTLYIISNTHYTALLWFLSTKCVLFVVRMYYSSRIYCPFLFVLSMTSWFTLACYW